MKNANKVIETRDVAFDSETGECIHGECMSLAEWILWLVTNENMAVKLSCQSRKGPKGLSTMLCDYWELEPRDAYLVAQTYWEYFVPAEILDQLRYEIGRADLEYADNFRVYRVKDNLWKEDFDHCERTGCCGSAEFQFKDDDGDLWIAGCNYGH